MALRPVLLGGDIGIYAQARAFHEAWGVSSLCLSRSPITAIEKSRICEVRHITSSDDSVITELQRIAKETPEDDHVLMANSDLHSQLIARHYDELAPYYALPFPRLETFDLVSDKASFARLCASVGVATPPTVEVDFSHWDRPDWAAPEIPFRFPVVAKAASGAAYDSVSFPGKRKIWFIDEAAQLESLWRNLGEAGFRDVFLVQENIPGDNTQLRSLTAYVDRHGRAVMMGSARVLLEDHAPTMIGNPVAMITEAFPDLAEAATAILTAANYRGFANFDVKIDPRDNTPYFFEVNPRIGRNSYYMSAAGVNPMQIMVQDLVLKADVAEQIVSEEVLYSLVPIPLLRRYIRDPQLAKRVDDLAARAVDPLLYGPDNHPVRTATVHAQKLNQYRKFKRYYPHVTEATAADLAGVTGDTGKGEATSGPRLVPIDAEGMRIAAAGVKPLPIEQSPHWERFEQARGNRPWGRLAWVDEAGKTLAVMSLMEYSLRSVRYLWAKNGPVWLKSPTPARERELREALAAYLAEVDPGIVFVRLHASWDSPDLADCLQTITYDRTIVIDTCGGEREAILETFTKDGRRAIRRAVKAMAAGGAEVVDLTGLSRAEFDQVYQVLVETAKRDGFSPHPAQVYWSMLDTLGPEHARLFGVRYQGRIVCWNLVLVNEAKAVAYYGASSLEARKVCASDALDFEVSVILGQEGVRTYDLMGIDSPRVPQLYQVGLYKRRYAKTYTDVPGAFDFAIQRRIYSGLRLALTTKRRIEGVGESVSDFRSDPRGALAEAGSRTREIVQSLGAGVRRLATTLRGR